ncbi:hypothetical protein GCM10022225_19050 [Plantactinospora mayteni]|uniref:Uncharacterized protein n=1 Tax=Plantactinospora mayteni TaxID=566021 RepID=A0ABQ4EN83_9ACTN|nr:hypothetical protein Pma05_26620 [Plantactinospora mayteni]
MIRIGRVLGCLRGVEDLTGLREAALAARRERATGSPVPVPGSPVEGPAVGRRERNLKIFCRISPKVIRETIQGRSHLR